MLVRLEGVTKSFGDRSLFDSVDWTINAADRVALVGPNGCGKTTLLQLITGKLIPDRGQVLRKKDLSVFAVEQAEFSPTQAGSISTLSQALAVFGPLIQMEQRILHLQKEISERPDRTAQVADEYSDLVERFRLNGGYRFRSQTESVLQGVGFTQEAMHSPVSRLSGGQQSRLKLAQALLSEPELLVLDEPTNHLDIDAIEWLERYLQEIRSAVVLVSHDRFLLDQVTKRTVELYGGMLRHFAGSYSFYRKERELLEQQQAAAYRQQQEQISRTEDFIRRNIAGQKTKQAKSRRKMLEKLERVASVPAVDTMSLEFREAPGSSLEILRCEHLSVGYDGSRLIEEVVLAVRRGARFGIIGANGTGKTTLLRTFLGEVLPLDGKLQRADNLVWSYFSQTQESLTPAKTIMEEVHDSSPDSTEGTLRSYLAGFMFRGEDVFKRVGLLSGGERSRVALAKLLLRPAHVLLLDEPTNHLDIPAREVLETALQAFTGTLFVVSHDRYFLKRLGAEILLVRDRRLERFPDLESFEARSEGRAPDAPAPARAKASAAAHKHESVATPAAASKGSLSKYQWGRLQKRLLALEQRIHLLEGQRDSISEEMQRLGAREFQKMNELADSYEAIDLELSSAYSQWEALMMQSEGDGS